MACRNSAGLLATITPSFAYGSNPRSEIDVAITHFPSVKASAVFKLLPPPQKSATVYHDNCV
jgi:hypothetical protein